MKENAFDDLKSSIEIIKHSAPLLNPKIIMVEEGEMEEGIKKAIKLYAEQNPEYKAKLGESLKKTIPDLKIEENLEKNIIKKNKYLMPIIAGIGILGTIIFAVTKIKKRTPKKTDEQQTLATVQNPPLGTIQNNTAQNIQTPILSAPIVSSNSTSNQKPNNMQNFFNTINNN